MLFGGVISIIKNICVFFSVASDYKYTKVFKLLVHLGVGAYSAILPKGLYYYNLSLLEGPFCFEPTAFYRVFIEFPFGCYKILREE